MTHSKQNIQTDYERSKDRYAALGVDVNHALKTLVQIPVSLHCWQGDDVGGFENFGGALTGGIMATGNRSHRSSAAPLFH